MRRKHGYTHAFIDCDSLVNKYLPEKIPMLLGEKSCWREKHQEKERKNRLKLCKN